MSATARAPVRDAYDVAFDVRPREDLRSAYGVAFVKRTFAIDPATGGLAPGPAEPLVGDPRDETAEPRLPAHTDYWDEKRYADIAVVGQAFAPNGAPVEEMEVALGIGETETRLRVIGRRRAEVAGGGARIGAPEAFTVLPLGLGQAYGGLDMRVPIDESDPVQARLVGLETDWPGLSPRNPWGRGYVCSAADIDGIELPTQERPDARLTEESLIVDPERWWRAPRPAYLDWTPINCFPRNLFFAIECMPWHPPPDDETLPEVAEGDLPPGWRDLLAGQTFGTAPHWRFRQESAPGLALPEQELAGAPIRLSGLHPGYPEIVLTLPPPPRLEMRFGGPPEAVAPQLTAAEIRPDAERLILTYVARIEAVLRRSAERPCELGTLKLAGRTVDLRTRVVTRPDGSRVELTEREAEVLHYLASAPGRPVSRDELLRRVWGIDPRGVRSRTVDMAIARLREHLGDDPAWPEMIRTVRARGYMLALEPV